MLRFLFGIVAWFAVGCVAAASFSAFTGCVTMAEALNDRPSCLSVVSSFMAPRSDTEVMLPSVSHPYVGSIHGIIDEKTNMIRTLCVVIPEVGDTCKVSGDLLNECLQSGKIMKYAIGVQSLGSADL
jgi:hypothetical protein